jgi:hypothetical protein
MKLLHNSELLMPLAARTRMPMSGHETAGLTTDSSSITRGLGPVTVHVHIMAASDSSADHVDPQNALMAPFCVKTPSEGRV